MATQAVCSIEGCDKPVRLKTLGWCNAHYLRARAHGGDPLAGKAPRGAPLKFYREVVLCHTGDNCLIWPFARNDGGYARLFSERGETTLVHRMACEEIHGPPPTPEHHAAHSCGRGHEGCVSPIHCRWATPGENAADQRVHGTAFVKSRGDLHPRAKLTAVDVREIRANRGRQTTPEVAARYGVKPETIKAIYLRRSWSWLT